MANNNDAQTQRVIFQIDTGPVVVVSNILKKYDLEESSEEACKKIKEGKKPRVNIIIQAASDLVLNKISETGFISTLEKQLEITRQIAEKIISDVKEKLLSTAKKITVGELKTSEGEAIIVTSIKPPIGLEKTIEEVSEPVLKTPPRVKKPLISEISEKTKEAKKPSKKADVYRESIE